MPPHYVFKDSKAADTVAKALLFVAKFSKKQALVRFSDKKVTIIWGGSPKTYYIETTVGSQDIFRNKVVRTNGVDHAFVILIDPSILGKTLKGSTQDRNVTIFIVRPDKVKVQVESMDSAKRTLTHTLPCDIKSLDDFNSMLISEIERTLCRYTVQAYVDNIHRVRHVVDSFVRLNAPKVCFSAQTLPTKSTEMTIMIKTDTCRIRVNISDLDSEGSPMDHPSAISGEDNASSQFNTRRSEANVIVDAKKLATFLGSLVAQRKSRACFAIDHNKCLKITLSHSAAPQGETFDQSILLLHSLN